MSKSNVVHVRSNVEHRTCRSISYTTYMSTYDNYMLLQNALPNVLLDDPACQAESGPCAKVPSDLHESTRPSAESRSTNWRMSCVNMPRSILHYRNKSGTNEVSSNFHDCKHLMKNSFSLLTGPQYHVYDPQEGSQR